MPPTDFVDLAARMSAGVAGVRACLVLTKDGLSLGAHPAAGEVEARQAWEAWNRLGDPQRGFVDMGTEIWVVASGAAYAAVMVATPDVKPGLLLDRMSAELLAAEESRSTSAEPAMAVVDLSTASTPRADVSVEPPPPPARRPSPTGSVDRVALAREFGRLLEHGPLGDHDA